MKPCTLVLCLWLTRYRLETDKLDAELTPEIAAEMLRKGWLRRAMTIEDPGQGPGSEKDFTSTKGVVTCSVHHTLSR